MSDIQRADRVPLHISVLGVDVDSSPTRPSSAVCRLDRTEVGVTWTIRRVRAVAREQEDSITAMADEVFLEPHSMGLCGLALT